MHQQLVRWHKLTVNRKNEHEDEVERIDSSSNLVEDKKKNQEIKEYSFINEGFSLSSSDGEHYNPERDREGIRDRDLEQLGGKCESISRKLKYPLSNSESGSERRPEDNITFRRKKKFEVDRPRRSSSGYVSFNDRDMDVQDSKRLNDREVLSRIHEKDRLPTSSILKSRESQGDGYHRESRIRIKGDTDKSYRVRMEVHEGDKRLDDESDRYRRNSSNGAHKSDVKKTSEEYIPVYSEPEYRNRKQGDASCVDYAGNHFRHSSVRDEPVYHLPISDNRRYPEMDDIGGKSNYSREYRSRFTDDEDGRRNFKKKSKHDVIKLGYFDGTTASQPLEAFLVQLNNAAEFNDWTIKIVWRI